MPREEWKEGIGRAREGRRKTLVNHLTLSRSKFSWSIDSQHSSMKQMIPLRVPFLLTVTDI